jgi:hypothetical protein
VVTPDGHLLDVGDLGSSLEGELSECSVVVESGHGGEAGCWKIWGVVLADKSIGVGWVSNNDGLDITGGVVVDGFANIDEDLAVVLEEVTSLHSWSSWLGTDKEVVVDIFEGGGKIARDDDLVEEWEGAIMELSLDTLENLLLEGKIKQVKDDSLVLAEEFTTGDSVDNGVGDLAGGSGNEDTLWCVVEGGSGGHGSLGNWGNSAELSECLGEHLYGLEFAENVLVVEFTEFIV